MATYRSAFSATAPFLFAFLASCDPQAPSNRAPILLFTGNGTSAGDVAAVERILKDNHLEYATATSRQLNGMSESQLMAYRLMVVPGGNFIDMASSLTPKHDYEHSRCRAGRPELPGNLRGRVPRRDGHGYYNSVNLTSGVRFGFYGAEARGIRKAAVAIAGVGLPPIEHYWEDGPEFTGWGAVVGKYPEGAPAIVEGTSGKGWVILSGVHPEAPETWRRGMTFSTPASVANAYAGTLIQAALHGTSLPHY